MNLQECKELQQKERENRSGLTLGTVKLTAIPSKMKRRPETWRVRVESFAAGELFVELWSFFRRGRHRRERDWR